MQQQRYINNIGNGWYQVLIATVHTSQSSPFLSLVIYLIPLLTSNILNKDNKAWSAAMLVSWQYVHRHKKGKIKTEVNSSTNISTAVDNVTRQIEAP